MARAFSFRPDAAANGDTTMSEADQKLTAEFLAAALASPPERMAEALSVLRGARCAAAAEGPLLMTINDAARRLNVSRTTVRRAIRAGRLKKVEIYAGSFRLRRADVEAIGR
jgi:excisionase family DNA binding protein